MKYINEKSFNEKNIFGKGRGKQHVCEIFYRGIVSEPFN